MGRLRGLRLFRRRCYEVLDVGSMHDPASRIVHRGLVALVLVSVAATIFESIPSISERYSILFHGIEAFIATVFLIEFTLRVWAIVDHPPLKAMPRWRARLDYAFSPSMLIDFIAIVPLLLVFFLPTDLQVLLIL